MVSNSYTLVCPPVQGDNSQALVSGLSPVQVDKPWYNYLNMLNIGTPKTINFPFVPNGKLMIFRCPNILEHDTCN